MNKKKPGKLSLFFKALGPGLITGLSDDDPSGIATYSQAGARFGLATLWTALITFPLMAVIQEMCARIGLVTKAGLSKTLQLHYPKFILYLMLFLSFPAVILNIGADIEGMGAVANLLFPRISVFAFSLFFSVLLIFMIIKFSYKKIALILKWLCLVLVLYMFIPFMIKLDWADVLKKTVIPTIKLDKDFIAILVAILGTTISPYLFFWQTTMEAEDVVHKNLTINKGMVSDMKKDVNTGMLFSNIVMFFIILTTGAVLNKHGITKIDTIEQAAKALEPIAGHLAYYFFAIGIIGTGFLAIPVLAGSNSYILTESFGWSRGLDKKFHDAKAFYITIIISICVGLGLNFIGISPIQALIYSAILYGITAPVILAVILHICNNKKIMKTYTNSLYTNIMGAIALILMTAAVIALICY